MNQSTLWKSEPKSGEMKPFTPTSGQRLVACTGTTLSLICIEVYLQRRPFGNIRVRRRRNTLFSAWACTSLKRAPLFLYRQQQTHSIPQEEWQDDRRKPMMKNGQSQKHRIAHESIERTLARKRREWNIVRCRPSTVNGFIAFIDTRYWT